ncbi:SdpI family protein [Aureivirga sp. CE67]|uniref:SdpI family protein n=1 Tax=Aureivirga sp. CE67 TaxID=1788983 RepID=UPI0018C95CD4|nr:SdpI family protein [Aureivirga sp. CE67]
MSKEIISILVFDFLIILIPLLLYLFPPKEINFMYGYRTKRSVKNIENWRFSQKYFAKRWLFVPIIVILTQIVLYFTANIDLTKEPPLIPIISIIEFFIGSVFCFLSTENQLKQMNKEK